MPSATSCYYARLTNPEAAPTATGAAGEGWVMDAEQGVADEDARMGLKHVFVVNGAPEFLDLMRELLQDERYNVTTTNFVPRIFDHVAALRPDLLLLDIHVGEHSGWDLLERLHEDAATNGIPVVVVSTSPALLARAEAEAERYGGRAYLAKPFDLGELVNIVGGLIGPA